jgi:Na+-driven multidrug efflux pump
VQLFTDAVEGRSGGDGGLGAALALGSSPWWWLVVALAVVLLVGSPVLVGRLERRAELLADPPA